MRRQALEAEFTRSLKCLVGKRSWSVVAGEGTGSVFILHFGRKVPRGRPIANPHLTPDQRQYTGELSLTVWAAWRIETDRAVMCGWNDSNRKNGPMVRGLQSLVGIQVKAVTIQPPALDLTIRFGRKALRVFCDQTVRDTGPNNYWIRSTLTGRLYAVGPRGRLTMEHLPECPGR